MPLREIHIAAGLVVRRDGHVLLVRKAGTVAFIQPGGKLEPGETAVAALIRELDEELGLRIAAAGCVPLGRFSAAAVNEAGATVVADTFIVRIDAAVSPAREIAEIAWIDPDAPPAGLELAPLTRDRILPAWRRRS